MVLTHPPAARESAANRNSARREADVDALLRRRASLPDSHPDRAPLRGQAFEAALPTVERLAKRYAGRGEPFADLAQVAAVGLLKAVDGFDPRYASDFWAYATPTILGGIKRHFRDHSWAVEVPRRYKELRQEINRCRDEMTQRLRRPPDVAELAEQLGEDPQEISRALVAVNGYSWTSLYTAGTRGEPALADELGVAEHGYELVEIHETIQPALAQLPHREQYVIALRFFGDMTQSQIAKTIGVSQMHVSRILASALRRLRHVLADGS